VPHVAPFWLAEHQWITGGKLVVEVS